MKPPLDDDGVLSLVGKIYEACADPNCWPATLNEVGEALGGHSAALLWRLPRTLEPSFFASNNISADAWADYVAYYWNYDIWTQEAVKRPPNSVVTSSEIVGLDAFHKSTWFNEFLKGVNIEDGLFGVTENSSDAGFGTVSIYRPLGCDYFGPEEARILKVLLPHLRRAVELQEKVLQFQSQQDTLANLLARMVDGILFVDGNARVCYMNGVTERIASEEDGLRIVRGRLCASLRSETVRLHRAVATAAAIAAGEKIGPTGSLSVSRPSGRGDLSVTVSPLARSHRWGISLHPEARAIVLVSDPASSVEVSADHLRRLFGLTPAESALVNALIQGCSLQDHAERRGIAESTARTQLKNALAKTGTKRQGNLISVVLRSSPGHSSPTSA
jgi:DNA-binding CsgD family transcriptional regulator